MKFYKVHAAKFKNDKVIFMGEQFNEIGPDAFAQTEFEFIMLSDKVTIIRDHAFSNVRNCSVYIPASVEEIEPFSFEGMGSFNIIYCVKDSYAYNRCNELGVTVDTDVAACISSAKKAKEDDDQNKRIAANREAEQREAERIKKEAQEEAERIKKAAQEEAERIRKEAEEEAKRKEELRVAEVAKEQPRSSNNGVKQSVNTAKPVYTGPIFVDEEHVNKPKVTQQPPSKTVQPKTPTYDGPIFVDEEHRNRPTSTGTKKESSMFRDIDQYDDELKKMQPQVRKQPVARPVVQNKPIEQRKPSTGSVMRNLDDYDDELKEMNKKKQKKSGWGIFGNF